MGKNQEKKAAQQAAKVAEKVANDKVKVNMKFAEDKFYNDYTKPHFEAGKTYEVVGQDMVDRWLKRGGVIVGEGSEMNSEIVEPKVEDKDPVVDTSEKEDVELEEETLEDE